MSSERATLPDFLVVGAPKAGTTALHRALATHPQLYASPAKEPKYFLTAGHPPDPAEHRGPGDAHSAREWVWRRDDYERLFVAAPEGALRFESTPFYLWDKRSHARIARTLGPEARLIVVVRDPIDRAFSNWTHLRADGLEPEADFLAACRDEPLRVAAGWAPFWRYLELGRYGEQLEHLFEHVPSERVRVIRYRQLVDEPTETLNSLCAFLGVEADRIPDLPESNVGRWAGDGALNTVLRRAVVGGARLGGARLGAHLPPGMWRKAERSLLAVLQRGGHARPRLDPAVRVTLTPEFAADNARLSRLLGADYSDWLSASGRGMYTVRKSCEPSAAEVST